MRLYLILIKELFFFWLDTNSYSIAHMDENVANKLITANGEELTQRSKRYLSLVTPSVSRIDSSNLNPLDFWYCGVQLVSMNYQV